MKRIDMRIVIAALLIFGGLVFLLQNTGVIPPLQEYLFALVFALAGLTFLGVLLSDRQQWWAVIPGVVLLDLALIIAMSEAIDRGLLRLPEEWVGGVFLLGIAAAFFIVFFMRPDFWWAVIPAGVMSTLGIVAAFSSVLPEGGGYIFFFGLAITFALVGLLPVNNKRMQWPWIPAGILFLIGLLVLASAGNMINYLWPLAMIVGGGILLLRAFMRRA